MTKENELTVWVDVEDVAKVEQLDGFVPIYEYYKEEATNPYEWGKVEGVNITTRFRATSFVREIKRIFIG